MYHASWDHAPPLQSTAVRTSPRHQAPETVFEETFVPLEHGEMLHLSEPGCVTSARSFEALLTPGRGRLRPVDSIGHAALQTRAVSDTATVLPAPFRCVLRSLPVALLLTLLHVQGGTPHGQYARGGD